MNLVWHPLAMADRECIMDFIARDRPLAALALDENFETHADRIEAPSTRLRCVAGKGRIRETSPGLSLFGKVGCFPMTTVYIFAGLSESTSGGTMNSAASLSGCAVQLIDVLNSNKLCLQVYLVH
jgi:hypothetical protein